MAKTPSNPLANRPSAVPSKQSAKAATDDMGSNSLVRMLSLLDLFTAAAPAWSSDALILALGTSRSTGYRYIKALADIGMLAPVANGYYTLGPRIIELDLQIRHCDPLYKAAGPVLKKMASESALSAILCALFSGSVLCVREELAPDSPAHLFSRGQRRPLFRGAASKIILAHLGPHQLRSIYAKHKGTIATSGLGADWDSFRENLAEIRRAGFAKSVGEFNPDVIGIAAPIFNKAGQILGSIGVAGAESKFNRDDVERVVAIVKDAGRQVTDRVGVIAVGTDRPARAVG
ncbi:IclR family transcriptional regulator (plasmid) [Rhizobium ruizarguesonis]|uniref:IclR family transcriptional regulator n=1 Tax=Rhizobium TaxID=379 RepID=UPI0010321D7E|nr:MULTISPECIES: IclR family transcriptional regulator [Rhizobium]MBB3649127.1 DNA-binding IclR family transcriptional regulator [Rhizobium sp. BK619]NKL67348.1 helix-turn-helix domain-containing protein [Rhizobium leguminosarum bv. viciae]TBB14920.1 IclR family transcriptional regulator [Rhizobium ruizarguesonis]